MFDNKGDAKTSLASLGEFGLIKHLTKDIELKNDSTIKGVGDDATVLDFKDKQTLISTDFLIEGIHFDLSYMPLKHLGYKAIMVNLSDIFAMNAEASQVTVSIAVSNRFPLEAIEELYAGIYLACNIYNIDLVGGDTTSSTSGLIISVTAVGHAKAEDVVYRSGAKDKDLLVVSGDLGAAYMGFQILEREKEVFKVNPNNQPDLSPYTYLLERQMKPEARQDVRGFLSALDVKPTSMIDISDGLSSEILHICEDSKVGANLFEDKIPLDPSMINVCEEFNLDSTTIALSGGEDYELLFTIDQKDYDKIKGNPNFSIIGHMKPETEGKHLITRDGLQVELTARGWNALENEE